MIDSYPGGFVEYCSECVYGIQFVGIASYLCFIYIKPHSCMCSCDIGCDKKIAPFSQIHQNVVHSKRFLFKVCLYIFFPRTGCFIPHPDWNHPGDGQEQLYQFHFPVCCW